MREKSKKRGVKERERWAIDKSERKRDSKRVRS